MKAIFFVGAFLLLMGCQSAPPSAPQEAAESRESQAPRLSGVLVVNYFENNSENGDELDWLSRSVTDFLISELTAFDFVQVVSRENLNEVLAEQEFAALSGLTEKSIEMGRMLSADYVLSGDYYEHDGRLTLNARVLDAETAETVRSFQVRGRQDNVYTMQERLLYEFLRFSNVGLNSAQLAARDYETDSDSIERFYRAERLIEEDRNEEAQELLERLLAENHLFSPAQDKLDRIQPVEADTGQVDGRAAVAEADAEVRRRTYYRNLTDSFIAYTQAHAYRVEMEEPSIESRDGRHFRLEASGRLVVRDEYLSFLYDFIDTHAYIRDPEKEQLLHSIRETQEERRESPNAFPRSLQIRFTDQIIAGDTENVFGFAKASLLDVEGNAMWEFYSTQSNPSFSMELGAFPPAPHLGSTPVLETRYRDRSGSPERYYAYFGPRNNRSVLSNSLWLTQPEISLQIGSEFMEHMLHELDEFVEERSLSRRDQAEEFDLFYLTREEVEQLVRVVIEPYFLRTDSSIGL